MEMAAVAVIVVLGVSLLMSFSAASVSRKQAEFWHNEYCFLLQKMHESERGEDG